MKNITISIEEEQLEYLNTLPNQSAFIRASIDEKRGKAELGLQDLEAIVIRKQAELDESILRYNNFLETQLENKEELRQREKEELERKKVEQESKDVEFKKHMEALIGNEPEIQNFKFFDGWDTTSNLIDLVELFRLRGIRVGIFEVRKYLFSKQSTE